MNIDGFWGDLVPLLPDEAWGAVLALSAYGLVVLLILVLAAVLLWAVPPRGIKR